MSLKKKLFQKLQHPKILMSASGGSLIINLLVILNQLTRREGVIVIGLKKWVFKMMEPMIFHPKISHLINLKMNKEILIRQDQLNTLLNLKLKTNNLYLQSDLLLSGMMKF